MAAAGVTLLSSGETGSPKQRAWGLIQEESQPASPGQAPHPRLAVPRITHDSSLGPQGHYLPGQYKALPLDCVTAFHLRPSRKAPRVLGLDGS